MALFVLFDYNLKFIFTDIKELPMGKLPKAGDKPQTLRKRSGPGIAYWILSQQRPDKKSKSHAVIMEDISLAQ